MKDIDCDECMHSYYEEDKLRCELEECSPVYNYACCDCERFGKCEYTTGGSQAPCTDFELIN